MAQTRQIPQIAIHAWQNLILSKAEIRNILIYLAYKTGKPVIFRRFADYEGYSENTICVCIAVADGIRDTSKSESLKLNSKSYDLSDEQVATDLILTISEEKQIKDDDGLLLAFVDHNRIVIPLELTATDNEAAKAILAYVIEQSIELLDFRMTEELLERRKKFMESICDYYAKTVVSKLKEAESNFNELEQKAYEASRTIYSFEQQRPVLEKQIRFLKKLQQIRRPRLYRQQAYALIELIASGQFTSIEPQSDGGIIAVTGPITIEYDNWEFPLGSYNISLNNSGDINIEALDDHPNAEHPHPHVDTDGYPCLGNIAADIPKLIGSMRIAEALQLLYQFLSSYNSDNPYERIGHFDPTGRYQDEEDEPCEHCDEAYSPACIFECSHNNGQYTCTDCYDYRTDYCYLECVHNEDFENFSPCDDCSQKGTEYCYLNCQFNNKWQLQNPCDDNCSYEECDEKCPYFEKSQTLTEANKK